MKKLISLLLVLCLALSLSACAVSIPTPNVGGGAKTPETKGPETKAPETKAPETDEPAPEPPSTEAPTTQAPATEAPTTEPPAPATTEAPAAPAVRGVTDGKAYVNEYLNLRIALPKGWTFYTDEQIAQVNNMTAETLKDTDFAELIAQGGQFIDMLCSDAYGNNMNIVIQPSQPLLDAYTDQQIFELSEQTYTTQMAIAGLEILYYETMIAQIGGEDHDVLHMVLSNTDRQIEEFQLWFREPGDYMGILTITLVGEIDLLDVLNCISPLN